MIGLLTLGVAVPLAMAAELLAPPPGLPLRLIDAEAQYQSARQTHRAGSAARGASRWLELERALRAYRAVEQYFPRHADRCAEAAYRRGEVERSLDRLGRARAAFESVLDHRSDPDWAARARLQLALLSGRRGEPGEALQQLAEVIAAPRVSPQWRNRARQRRAELLLELGHPAAAYSTAASWLPEVSSTERFALTVSTSRVLSRGTRIVRSASMSFDRFSSSSTILTWTDGSGGPTQLAAWRSIARFA